MRHIKIARAWGNGWKRHSSVYGKWWVSIVDPGVESYRVKYVYPDGSVQKCAHWYEDYESAYIAASKCSRRLGLSIKGDDLLVLQFLGHLKKEMEEENNALGEKIRART